MLNKSKPIECPVCKAAGKSDIAHWIQNDKGNVVCPTLLQQNCRYCGQNGHTPKYCLIKKQEERDARRNSFRSTAAATAVHNSFKIKKNDNLFRVFDDSSSDEEEQPTMPVANMTKDEKIHLLCETLGCNRRVAVKENKQVVIVPTKRLRWSEMFDSDDEDE